MNPAWSQQMINMLPTVLTYLVAAKHNSYTSLHLLIQVKTAMMDIVGRVYRVCLILVLQEDASLNHGQYKNVLVSETK